MIDISVIVPIYGVERFIERSLVSLFTQTKTEGVEFILVNDCTPDSSMMIVEELLKRYPLLTVHCCHHEKNMGLAAARKTGMTMAKGEYVLHVDSDDWFELDMLEEMHQLAVIEDVDVVASDYYVDYHEHSQYVKQQAPTSGLSCAEAILEQRLFGSNSNKMIRRSLFVNHQIEWIEGIDMWEDFLTVTRVLCYADKVAYIPRAFLHYVQHSSSLCAIESLKKFYDVQHAVEQVEHFILQRGFKDRLYSHLIHKKLNVQFFLLCYTRGEMRDRSSQMYPELQEEIFGLNNMSIDRKLALWMGRKGHLWAFDCWMQLRLVARQILKQSITRVK